MATPTYNGASVQVSDVDGNSTAITGTLTASAGSNRFLEVTVCVGAGSPDAHNGVTWGGVALTQRGSTLTIGPYGRMSKWYLKEASFPGGASGTVDVSLNASQDEVWVAAVLYNDVDQTNPYKNGSLTSPGAVTENNAASVTVTSDATSLVTGSTWGIDLSGTVASIASTAGTTRQEVDNFNSGGFEAGSVADIAGSSPNTVISWAYTLGANMDDQGSFGDALQYSAGGGGGSTLTARKTLLGVGL